MAENLGKKFENVIESAFRKVEVVSIDRIHDQTTGFKSSSTNIADFVVYRKPYEYYIECKSVHGNTLSIYSNPKPDKQGVLHGFYGNITDAQWNGLLEKSKIDGVHAGIICWWVDKDVTMYIPIDTLVLYRDYKNKKSIRYDESFDFYVNHEAFVLKGKKKRVFFDYDMNDFLQLLNESET